MPFSKKDPNISGGRPKGSKDKVWATLQYWFEKLNKDLENPDLAISDKVKAELKCIELILEKRALPSESSEESVTNAADALKLLKDLEASTLNEFNARTNQNRLDGGSPKI